MSAKFYYSKVGLLFKLRGSVCIFTADYPNTMKIILTGATGFVGAHVVRLLGEKHELVVLARQRELPPQMRPYIQQHIVADLGRDALPLLEADACIHIAGLATDQARYTDLYAANVLATERLFAAVQSPLFIHISSVSVYDDTQTRLRETDAIPMDLLTDYGKTKRLAELSLMRLNETAQRKVVMLRPRAIYGTGDRVLLPRMLALGRRGVFSVPGTLDTRLSMTHVGNLAAAIERSLAHYSPLATPITEIFNISDTEPYLLRDVLLRLYAEVYGGDWRIRALPVAPLMRVAEIMHTLGIRSRLTPQAIRYLTRDTVVDTQHIRQTLDFVPQHTFFNALPEIGAWVKRVGVARVQAADPLLPWA